MAKKKTEVLSKSNRLVEAAYKLTLTEMQLLLYAVYQSTEEQKGLPELQGQLFSTLPVTIRAIDFARRFSIDESNSYGMLADAVDKLFNRYIRTHDIHPESGKPRVNKIRWVSQASYVPNAGIVQITFTHQMVPFITRLSDEKWGFTQFRLEMFSKLGMHAIRLYELLYQHRAFGKRELEIEWLKETFELGAEYERIVDFKKWVIHPAVDQINEHTDIDVTWTQRKTGVKVTHFDFTIKAKAEVKPKATKKKIEKIMPPTQDAPQETEEQIAKNKARAKELKQICKSFSGQLDLLLDQPS